MNAIMRQEASMDLASIRDVNLTAFGQEDESTLVDALRAGGYARLSLVAELDDRIVGHILFSDLPIVGPEVTTMALALAPMAVRPGFQRQGIGSRLVLEGLRHCAKEGHRIVIVLGHPEFYPRFGFSAQLAEPLSAPFSGNAFMALELVDNALAGITGEVRYPRPFGIESAT